MRTLCVATGVPQNLVFDAAVQPSPYITQVTGGNPNLSPETSNTTTLGLIYTPHQVRNLALSYDYFDITLDNAISTLGGGGLQNVLNLCYYTIQDAGSVYCKAIHRDPTTGEVTGPNYVTTTNANIGGVKTSGVDIDGHYSFRTHWGLMGASRWDVSANWTYTQDYTLTPIQGLRGTVDQVARTLFTR